MCKYKDLFKEVMAFERMGGCLQAGGGWVGEGPPGGGAARAKADKPGWVWADGGKCSVAIAKGQEVRSGGDAGRGSGGWGWGMQVPPGEAGRWNIF